MHEAGTCNTEPQPNLHAENTRFHIVSIAKLLIMGPLSLGFYVTYCNYRHWLHIRGERGLKLIPLLCALFGGFTLYWLMRHIVARCHGKNVAIEGTALSVAFMYWTPAVAMLGWQLLVTEPVARSLPLSMTFLIPIMLVISNVIFSLAALVQIQQAANACEGDPLGLQNTEITRANVLWIVISWMPVAALLGYMSTYAPLMQ